MEVKVPDIGDFEDVPVIEILVAAGDEVTAEQPLVTLESDKATMDVPSPFAGTVKEVLVSLNDKVSEGSPLLQLETTEGAGGEEASESGEGDDARQTPAARDEASAEGPDSQAAERLPDASPSPDSPDAHPDASPSPASASPSPDLPDADRTAQVLVIGAGPGGYTAAFRAADLGLRVILVERYERLGGVCLNVGCIPSKALLHAARVIAEAEEAADFGIEFGKPEVAVERLRGWKDDVVGKLTGGLAGLAKQRKVEVVTGTARFTSDRTVDVDGTSIAFESCILAAGSSAVMLPGFPDDERVVDSTGALELADVPERLLVVGGGIIGLEMGGVYDALGSAVTVVELTDQLIPGCDRDLVKPLQARLAERFEAILLATKVASVEAEDAGLRVAFEGEGAPEPQLFDRVLVAVGRRANGAELGLDAAGVEIGENGQIEVDPQRRTNVPHIYAIGDLTAGPMLAHKASHEGVVAAEVIAGNDVAFDPRAIPSVAYTDPEVAWAGLNETDAVAAGTNYEKTAFPWAASGRALSIARPEGMTKLLVDPETRRVLGVGIVGINAGELIAEATLAIEMGADAEDLGLTIHAHPTLSETVMFAAEMAEGTITDLYAPKRRRGGS
jgi:dihydrolipoamide dehydrogenase